MELVDMLLSQPAGTPLRTAALRLAASLHRAPVAVKALLLRTLHLRAMLPSGALTATGADDLAICEDVLLHTRGLALTELKVRLDVTTAEHVTHDLLSLVRAISQLPGGPQRRARLLDHFLSEACPAIAELRKHCGAASIWPVKVYTDIDDTLKPSLLDYSFPSGQPYPGIGALLLALQGAMGAGAARNGTSLPSFAPPRTRSPISAELKDAALPGAAGAVAGKGDHGDEVGGQVTVASTGVSANSVPTISRNGRLHHRSPTSPVPGAACRATASGLSSRPGLAVAAGTSSSRSERLEGQSAGEGIQCALLEATRPADCMGATGATLPSPSPQVRGEDATETRRVQDADSDADSDSDSSERAANTAHAACPLLDLGLDAKSAVGAGGTGRDVSTMLSSSICDQAVMSVSSLSSLSRVVLPPTEGVALQSSPFLQAKLECEAGPLLVASDITVGSTGSQGVLRSESPGSKGSACVADVRPKPGSLEPGLGSGPAARCHPTPAAASSSASGLLSSASSSASELLSAASSSASATQASSEDRSSSRNLRPVALRPLSQAAGTLVLAGSDTVATPSWSRACGEVAVSLRHPDAASVAAFDATTHAVDSHHLIPLRNTSSSAGSSNTSCPSVAPVDSEPSGLAHRVSGTCAARAASHHDPTGIIMIAGDASTQPQVLTARPDATDAVAAPAPVHGLEAIESGRPGEDDSTGALGPVLPAADSVHVPGLGAAAVGSRGTDLAALVSGMAVLSARPALMKATTLATATAVLGGRPPHAVLCGTLLTSLTHEAMGIRKAAVFAEHSALFPEHRVVWLGDSGQGDMVAGLRMLQAHAHSRAHAHAQSLALSQANASAAGVGSRYGTAAKDGSRYGTAAKDGSRYGTAAKDGFPVGLAESHPGPPITIPLPASTTATTASPLLLVATPPTAGAGAAAVGGGAHSSADTRAMDARRAQLSDGSGSGALPSSFVSQAVTHMHADLAAPCPETSFASAERDTARGFMLTPAGSSRSSDCVIRPGDGPGSLSDAGASASGVDIGDHRVAVTPCLTTSRCSGVCLDWLPPPPLVLIHDIAGADQRPKHSAVARSRWRARGIHLFDSVAEAAAISYESRLLDAAALQQVVDATVRDVAGVRFTSERQRIARLRELQEGMMRARLATESRT